MIVGLQEERHLQRPYGRPFVAVHAQPQKEGAAAHGGAQQKSEDGDAAEGMERVDPLLQRHLHCERTSVGPISKRCHEVAACVMAQLLGRVCNDVTVGAAARPGVEMWGARQSN